MTASRKSPFVKVAIHQDFSSPNHLWFKSVVAHICLAQTGSLEYKCWHETHDLRSSALVDSTIQTIIDVGSCPAALELVKSMIGFFEIPCSWFCMLTITYNISVHNMMCFATQHNEFMYNLHVKHCSTHRNIGNAEKCKDLMLYKRQLELAHYDYRQSCNDPSIALGI